jgi:dipeptidase
MKLFLYLALRAFMSVTIVVPAVACTNFLVTKGASADGATMISYNADSFTFYGELYFFPAARYPEGAMLDIYEWDTGKFLGRIRQARETYNVIGNMNEYQVVIGETTFGGREQMRNSKGIIDYGSLMYIALQRSKTAREAIQVMTGLANEYGYPSEGESFSVGDPNEAWILEMLAKGEGQKGVIWAAVRIPDGYVSAHANHARITAVSLKDPDNCLHSPDVISFAREKGYFTGKDADFSFADAYAPLEYGAIRFCDARVWSLFRRVNKSMDRYISTIKGESMERLPIWVKPEKKLSAQDVMQLMRDHYEGTDLDMTKGIAAGPYGAPYRWRPLTWEYQGQTYFNERPISTPQTGFCFVSQSRSWLPREVGGVLWFGVDDSYMTVYVPMYASMTKTPYNYSKGLGSLSQFSWDSAFWVFNFVSNFTYPRYSLIINDVKKVQNELEGMFASRQETVEKTALALYKNSRGEAIDYLTNYSDQMASLAYSRWKKLGEYLLVKYMDGVVKDEYFQPVNVGYPDAFKKLMVQEAGESIKMKKLPGSDTSAYQETVQKADGLVKEKKYSEARALYQRASEISPAAEWPRTRIREITTILNEIEDLHAKHFPK